MPIAHVRTQVWHVGRYSRSTAAAPQIVLLSCGLVLGGAETRAGEGGGVGLGVLWVWMGVCEYGMMRELSMT